MTDPAAALASDDVESGSASDRPTKPLEVVSPDTSTTTSSDDGGAAPDEVGVQPPTFLGNLARAMRATAEEQREQALNVVRADAKATLELVRDRSAGEASDLRTKADDEIAEFRSRLKAEIARLGEETETTISERKSALEREIEEHAATVESRIETVNTAVASYADETAAFFEHLLSEKDPAVFIQMAGSAPEAPRLAEIVDRTYEVNAEIDAGPDDFAAAEIEAALSARDDMIGEDGDDSDGSEGTVTTTNDQTEPDGPSESATSSPDDSKAWLQGWPTGASK